MQRLLCVLLFSTMVLLAACGGTPTEAPLDTTQLLNDVLALMLEVDTFRLSIEQSGAPYFILINIGTGDTSVEFSHATAQFVAPDVIQGTARIVLGAPLDIDIFARGENQWVRLGTASSWNDIEFAPGFNPASLTAPGGGFESALLGLREVQLVGSEELEEGSPVYHLTGVASTVDVAALTVGLIVSESDISVDLYIHRETGYPRRVVLVQPETVTEEEPEPTTWTIDVYDINAPAELDDPEGGASSTDETPEASPTEATDG